MQLILFLIVFPAGLWLRFWRAVRYWHFLHYSWHLAWHKAYRRDA